MLNKKLFQALFISSSWVMSLSSSFCFANETVNAEYAVLRSSQTLSDVASSDRVRSLYPGTNLYGRGGRLELLLKLNPHIKNQNKMFPGDFVLVGSNEHHVTESGTRQMASMSVTEQKEVVLESPSVQQEVLAKEHSYLHVSTGGSFFRVDSKDNLTNSSGTILSTLSPYFKMSWEPQINQKFDISMGFETFFTYWENPVGRTIENSQENISNFYFSYGHKGSQGSRVSVMIKQEETLVPRAITTETIRLEKPNTTSVGTELLFNILKTRSFQLDGQMVLGLSSGTQSGELKIEPGYYYDFGFDFSQNFKKYQIKSGVRYSKKEFDTNYSANENSQLQFSIGLGFKLEE